jgi:peptidoglycan hydrolase-like protein with peptidoglycan-binding domain
MTKATNNVARVAAAVAGLGLVAMTFAPLAQAQTATATTTTTTTTSASFTRDLTLGSTGADVTALQTWLISAGFSIPAGATGYFGAQTKAALASYQAAHSISPAAGYFGPITRAAVAAAGGSTTTTSTVPGCAAGALYSSTTGQACAGTTTTTTTTSTTLSGGEADLRNYDLQSGDDLSEGDSNKEIAVAKFDVRGGDVAIQRVTVDLQPTLSATNANLHPWSYFDTLSVYNGSTKVGSVDVSSKSDWDQENAASGADFTSGNDYYTLDIPVNTVVKEGDNNELSIRADAVSTIDTGDTDQTFNFIIPTDGIRAVDAKGIQEYTGSNGDVVTVGFNAAQNGDLSVRTSSDNPNAGVLVADDQDTSDSYDVLAFRIKNSDDTDVDFNSLTFTAVSASSTVKNIVRRATLKLDGDTYTGTIGNGSSTTITFDNLNTSVNGNDTIDGTLSVELYGQSGHFSTSGESLTFSLAGNTPGNVDAESSDTGDSATVSGTATGKTQSIGINAGITVQGNNSSASESYNSQTASSSTGTFTIKFDVTANGDNDIYVPKAIMASASTTAGVVLDATLGSGSGIGSPSVTLNSTADVDPDNSNYWLVRSGDTETFTALLTTDPSASGYYQVGLDKVRFTTVSTGGSLQTLDVDQTDADFQTDPLYIH